MRFEKQRTRVAVLGEKLTPIRTLGGGLTLAGVMLHGWVRNARGIEFPKSLTWRPIDLPPAHMKGARRSDGRSLDP